MMNFRAWVNAITKFTDATNETQLKAKKKSKKKKEKKKKKK